MTKANEPQAISDEALDDAQGGSVFGTPSGGWGVRRREGITADSKDPEDGNKFATAAGGDPNV